MGFTVTKYSQRMKSLLGKKKNKNKNHAGFEKAFFAKPFLTGMRVVVNLDTDRIFTQQARAALAAS